MKPRGGIEKSGSPRMSQRSSSRLAARKPLEAARSIKAVGKGSFT